MKLDLMALKPDEKIGSEVHAGPDPFVRTESGRSEIRIASE